VQINLYYFFFSDLRVSNNKLFFRAVKLIAELAGRDEEAARLLLLRAIYALDEAPTEEVLKRPVSQHIQAAASQKMVLPLALLLSTNNVSVANARAMLAKEPILRKLVKSVTHS